MPTNCPHCRNGWITDHNTNTVTPCTHCRQTQPQRAIQTQITLTDAELEAAAIFAVRRRCASRKTASHNIVKSKHAKSWNSEIDQVAAVHAAAKALGLTPKCSFGTGQPDCAGPIRIRYSSHPNAQMRAYAKQNTTEIQLLVTGTGDTFKLRGWERVSEIIKNGTRDHLEAESNIEVYVLPQSRLKPVATITEVLN